MDIRKRAMTHVLAGLLTVGIGCADPVVTEPRVSERPSPSMIGLDESKRLPPQHELGGDSAMRELSNRLGAASATAADPLVRAVAEWQANQGVIKGKSALRQSNGVEYYDGDYYVWSGGESYAPAHKTAKIYNMVARASRNGDPVDIDVTFNFDGHRASNEAQWTISRSSTGETLISRPWRGFGSQTDPFMGLTAFGRRGWAASTTEYITPCDVTVNGNTEGRAWYEGFWEIAGVSFGINPSQAVSGQINLSKGRSGEAQVGASLNTFFTCPPPSSGYGGGDTCNVCQQWFYVFYDWIIEWWECGPADPSECTAYAT